MTKYTTADGWRIITKHQLHLPVTQISADLMIPIRHIQRVLKHWKATKSVTPLKGTGERRPRLLLPAARDTVLAIPDSKSWQYIVMLVDLNPAIQLDELCSSIADAFIITLLKQAIECDSHARAAFTLRMSRYCADQLVFGDESAVDRKSSQRRYGWSRGQQRAYYRAVFVHGKQCTLLAVVAKGGFLSYQIKEGP
ncbi:hypothetical protein BDR26DRAFT_919591 [Obelidium mucronatum]|nr:hypothetical protein BDR26DRAFT_919591 [Obelidium mucronatum]